jgi:hypothetical protein
MLMEIFLLLPATLCRNAMEILQFANKVSSPEVTECLKTMLNNG